MRKCFPCSFLWTWDEKEMFLCYGLIYVIFLVICQFKDRFHIVIVFNIQVPYPFNKFLCFPVERVAEFKYCYVFSVIQADGVFRKALTDISCTW